MLRISLLGTLIGVALFAFILWSVRASFSSVHEFDAKITRITFADDSQKILRVETSAKDLTTGALRFLTVYVPTNEWNLVHGQDFRISCEVDIIGGIHLRTCKPFPTIVSQMH